MLNQSLILQQLLAAAQQQQQQNAATDPRAAAVPRPLNIATNLPKLDANGMPIPPAMAGMANPSNLISSELVKDRGELMSPPAAPSPEMTSTTPMGPAQKFVGGAPDIASSATPENATNDEIEATGGGTIGDRLKGGVKDFLGSDASLALAAGILEGGTSGEALGRGFKYALGVREEDDKRNKAAAASNQTAAYLESVKANPALVAMAKAGNGAAALEIHLKGLEGASKGAQDAFKETMDLRKEYESQETVKDYETIRAAYQKIRTSAKDKTGAGDMSLIFGYMKLRDPGSTVREGEYATASNTGSIPETIWQTYNKALTGEKLTPTLRFDFVRNADSIYRDTVADLEATNKRYSTIGAKSGINPDDIIFKPETMSPPNPREVGVTEDRDERAGGGTSLGVKWKIVQ